MGEQFVAASGLGPCQWAAAARALGFGKTQPELVPGAPQFTCRPEAGGPGGPRARRPRSASHRVLCRNSQLTVLTVKGCFMQICTEFILGVLGIGVEGSSHGILRGARL